MNKNKKMMGGKKVKPMMYQSGKTVKPMMYQDLVKKKYGGKV